MAQSPFKRFVAQVPLIVQALAIAALAGALARPATRGRAFSGDHVAIILDTSASMSALAPGGEGAAPVTRLDLAKRAAHDLLSALTPGSDALVLEAARDARVLSPLDRDLVRVGAAIDRAVARDVEGDLGQAVALAVDRLRPLGGTRRIVVLTDGDLAHPAALSGAALPVEVITVGAPVDNAAIVRVDVRSGKSPGTGAEQVQAFLVIANFGQKPRDLYVTMREENASDVLASRRVVVKPGERLPVPLEFLPTPGDYRKGLIFEISPRDAMPVDDVAYARVPAGDKLPVFLAGASPWIERALAADPLVDLRTGTLAELEKGAAIDLDTFVVVDGACPAGAPGGDLLVVHPPPGRCSGAGVGAAVEHPEITSWESGDPRMRFLTLDGVHVARANLIEPAGASQDLVKAREGTLISDISTSARTATLVGFDPGDSDWPLKASFVLFVRNLLELARTHRAHGITGPARAGEPMRVSLPPRPGRSRRPGRAGRGWRSPSVEGWRSSPTPRAPASTGSPGRARRRGRRWCRPTSPAPPRATSRTAPSRSRRARSPSPLRRRPTRTTSTPGSWRSSRSASWSSTSGTSPAIRAPRPRSRARSSRAPGCPSEEARVIPRRTEAAPRPPRPSLARPPRLRLPLPPRPARGARPAARAPRGHDPRGAAGALRRARLGGRGQRRLPPPGAALGHAPGARRHLVHRGAPRFAPHARQPVEGPARRRPHDDHRVLRGDGRGGPRDRPPPRSAHGPRRRRPQPLHRSRPRRRATRPPGARRRRGGHARRRPDRRHRLRRRGRHRGSTAPADRARRAAAGHARARRDRPRRRHPPRAGGGAPRLRRPGGAHHRRRRHPGRHHGRGRRGAGRRSPR